jgi:two-component system response regulator PhoP
MYPTTPDKSRVFLVEDSADLREEIVFGLTALGFEISGFMDAVGLYRALAVKDCDIAVIDIGLPGEDGFSIAQHLRNNPALGIIFLTARASLDDRLHGLGLGADAYLVKPIDMRELAATVHAVQRRLNTKMVALQAVPPATVEIQTATPVAHWSLSLGDWTLRNPQGLELALSDAERRFLKIMMASAGQVVQRETLIAAFTQEVDDYDPHRLDAVISRLRKRIELAGLGSFPLQSIRGTGYVLSVQERRLAPSVGI